MIDEDAYIPIHLDELPGPLADLLTQADRFIAQYAPEMNTDALSEAHSTLDAARALVAERAWLSPDQIDSLAYHPIDWMTMRFYLALGVGTGTKPVARSVDRLDQQC